MIRAMLPEDIDDVMEIWRESAQTSHGFMSEDYWQHQQVMLKQKFLNKSHLFLWEENEQIRGFISLSDKSYIDGIFISPQWQKKGIGSALLLSLQQVWPVLSLRIYAKNLRAVGFARHHGFKIIMSEIDKKTGEEMLLMYWSLGYLTIDNPRSHSSKPSPSNELQN